ncbi:glycerol kinase GlpK [Bordetella genomosp. 13]|uniref:Glycerol kinase n=1 Tax=Bordetella genomosp. 13 TaxID=463040 RepID=A0A1W6ZH43_9BORD|nr:glycerol kinase GlpK [Bordetella genomosp. 13]ARP96676.1 glycerol kinase [Bordetella genomosp. 13]
MTTHEFILALDQGTTSSRAIVFDRDGAVRGTGQREFRQYYPQPGWVEHDAGEIWSSQLEVAREALRNAGAAAADIAAIGITNQRETTLIWDRATGRPLARALVWQDRRTAPLCEQLRRDGHAEWLQQRTGLVVDAYFSGTKLAWLLEHVPGARQAAQRGELAFGTIDTWLVWQLTGGAVHSTDATNASRTMLYDLHAQDWNDDILELLRIPRSLLPTVAPSSGEIGRSLPELLGGAIPIAGVAGDQHAATFGQACFEPGMAKNTYGTGCFMLMNVGDRPVASSNSLLSTLGWSLPDPSGTRCTYMLEGGIFVAGAAVQWLRDGLGIIQRSADIESLAAQVDDTDDVFMVPAFAGLGAPHWDPYARGTIVGLTRGTTRAHVARATLESIALQSAELMACMNADSRIDLSELRVDGGATRNDLLMQMQADVLGVPVVRPRVAESTALGAAGLAGLATGFWASQEEFAAQWKADRRFDPAWSADRREARMARWRQAVEHAKGWGKRG